MTETSDIEDNVKIIKIQDVEKNVEKILEKNQSIHLNKSYDELNPLSTRIASIMSLNSMGGLPVENGKWYYFYSMKYTKIRMCIISFHFILGENWWISST